MKAFSSALLVLAGSVVAQTTINLPLQVINTALPKSYSEVGTGQSTDFTKFQGLPSGLTEKVIRTANTIPGQAMYESFLRGETDKTTWEQTKRGLGSDTLQLSPEPIRHQINTLVGTNMAGQRIVIVDANNNHDFGDDRMFTYPIHLPAIPKTALGFYNNSIHAVFDTLPSVSVLVESFDRQQIVQRIVSVKPIPYNTGSTYHNLEENRFHLALLAHEYRHAKTLLLGKPIEVIVLAVPGFAYNTKSVRVEVLEDGRPVNKLMSRGSFRPGYTYTFILADHVMEISGVSLQGDQLTLLDKGVIPPTR